MFRWHEALRSGCERVILLSTAGGNGTIGMSNISHSHGRVAHACDFLKRLSFSLAVILGLQVCIAQCDASPLAEAHFDSGAESIAKSKSTYWLYREKGNLFHIPSQGQSGFPSLSDKTAMDGSHSLRLSIGPSKSNQSDNDRSEFTVIHQDNPKTLQLGQERYLGFAIFFSHSEFPPPTAELIICQIWQSYKSVPTGPPAFIAMNRQSPELSFRLATRDDGGSRSHIVPLSASSFVRNSWNSVVLRLLPRPINDPEGVGIIEMWLNGVYIGGSRRHWGYASKNSINAFDVRVGLYANPSSNSHAVLIDNIRWGESKISVGPGTQPSHP